MSKRLLASLLFLFVPFSAAADDVSVPASAPSASLTAPSNASELGPATTGTANGSSAGDASSSADGASLQPAGTTPLQSTTNDSSGLAASSANTLQAPATSDGDLQVIAGDADGPTHQTTGQTSWAWLWFSLLLGALAAAVVLISRLRARQPVKRPVKSHPNAETPVEPTSSQRLNVTINLPPAKLFKFVLDPGNTPKWVKAITAEEANEKTPKLGTIYKNRDAAGNWSEYEITAFNKPETFELTNAGIGYHVRYTFTPVDDNATELEYYEWVDEGELGAPFTTEDLQNLKAVIEHPDAVGPAPAPADA